MLNKRGKNHRFFPYNFSIKNRRGISTIIATLLLILLTIVLIGILWVVIRNVTSSASAGINLGGLTLDLKIQAANVIQSNLSVVVQRQTGAGDLTGVNFILYDGQTYENIKQNANLSVYEGKDFIFSVSQINISAIKTVSVAPLYLSNSGAEQVGRITDTYTFKAADFLVGGGGTQPFCGDGTCNNGETSSSCSVDCPVISPVCGNGICELGETVASCPADCTVGGPVCGDGTCNGGETVASCPADCTSQTCTPATCQSAGYQCGAAPSGCGPPALDCGSCAGNTFCNNYFQCISYQMVNNGTILSVWPSGSALYFDSNDLPKSESDLISYNDGLHYIRFPNSNQAGCIRIALANYILENNRSYIELYSVANIAAGNSYRIWNGQQGCLNDA
jgi:flagellin-like protein